MGSFWQDVRYALRVLRKNPGFTAAAVLTLALGIGANTAIFSVINTLLFQPLPVKDAHQLVALSVRQHDSSPHSLSYPDYLDYRALTEVFTDVTAYTGYAGQLSADNSPADIILLTVASDNYFSTLGVEAIRGRVFQEQGGEAESEANVIVLSHGYWQRRFGGDPAVVGKPVRVNGRPFTIIGVLPENFTGTYWPIVIDGYVPMQGVDMLVPSFREDRENRADYGFRVIGRLRPGVSLEEAQAALDVQAARLQHEYPDTNKGVTPLVKPEPMDRLEPGASAFLPPIAAIFMGLVSLVLLIACANVANLLLARAAGRRKEIALRAALGAGRWRIVRQLLTESLLLAVLGGGAGLLLAHWATGVIGSVRIASDLPFDFRFTPDYHVFGFALALAVLAGVVSGLVPAFQAARTDLNEALKEGGRGAGSGAVRQWLRSALVVAQVAVSLVLLVTAFLFVQSLWNMGSMDLGFRTENRLLLELDLSLRNYDEARGRIFYRDLLERLRALPGVRSATLAQYLPISLNNDSTKVIPEGQVETAGEPLRPMGYNVVQTDYFKTMGMPIVEGRDFTPDDIREGRDVVIVNQVLAERLWPGQTPIGKRLSVTTDKGPFLEVVGVARKAIYNLPGERPRGFLYLPFSWRYNASQIIQIHTEGDPLERLPAVRNEIHSLDSELALFEVRSMEEHIRHGKGSMLLGVASGLAGSFGLIGMMLAAIGLYGVIAYSVSQRRHEIGIRMALGASPGGILRMVVSQCAALTFIGAGLGLAGALALTRTFGFLLVGVSPGDPWTLASVCLVLIGVAVLSTAVPAWRAMRVEPMVVLRYE